MLVLEEKPMQFVTTLDKPDSQVTNGGFAVGRQGIAYRRLVQNISLVENTSLECNLHLYCLIFSRMYADTWQVK